MTNLTNDITRKLIVSPKTIAELCNELKIGYWVLVPVLNRMLNDGTIAVTSHRFWLRGLGKADLHKAQDTMSDNEKEKFG